MRARQHAPGDVAAAKAVLRKDTRRVVGPLPGATENENLAVTRQFVQPCSQLRQGDVHRASYRLDGQFRRIAHVEQESAIHRTPVAVWHVAPQDVRGDHSRKIDRVLRAAERGRVAEFRLFQIVDRATHLDGHRQCVNSLGHASLTEHLGAQE